MNFGYFDDEKREYVITRPDTPAPWANYLGSPEYGALISNNAGGYSFARSGANGRILRYIFNQFDQPGRYIYLRDNESKDYWSASWQPVGKDLESYKSECHHGTADENTRAYIKAMENPNVNIIGHCDNEKFPVDYFALFRAAMENHVLLEINNSSLSPDGYRGDTTYADLLILNLSKHFNYPVLFSSDSHGTEHVGDFQYAEALARKAGIPEDLILNYSVRKFMGFLGER